MYIYIIDVYGNGYRIYIYTYRNNCVILFKRAVYKGIYCQHIDICPNMVGFSTKIHGTQIMG